MEGSTVNSEVNLNRPLELYSLSSGQEVFYGLESNDSQSSVVEFLDDDGTVFVYQYEVI